MKHFRLLLTFLTLILISVSSLPSIAKFDVHVIYFKPTDAPDIDHEYHDEIMKDIQKFYQSEMTRHGFTDKTFPLETDKDGNVVIHTINGKHNSNHYLEKRLTTTMFREAIEPELPFQFNNQQNLNSRDNVHLIIVRGADMDWGNPFTIGMGFTWHAGKWGGNAVVNMRCIQQSPHHYLALIAHEMAHAFGLDPGHNNAPGSLNSGTIAWGDTTAEWANNPWGNDMRMLDFEAALLDSRPIFKKIAIPEPTPKPNAKFDVHVIYFKPTDAGDIDHEYHDKILKDIQQYLQSEMTRHGFTDKTFPLETDENNKLIIHTINGKHNSEHYFRNTIFEMFKQTIEPELPRQFNNEQNWDSRDNVHLIIIGGERMPQNGGMGFTWKGGRWGGNAAVRMNYMEELPNHYLGLIAHELGHAFALDPGHNNIVESLNGRLIAWGNTTAEWGNRMQLLKEEAVLLDSRPIFRKINLQEDPPQPNKNEDLGLGEDDSDKDKGDPIFVNPRKKLTMTWGELKRRR